MLDILEDCFLCVPYWLKEKIARARERERKKKDERCMGVRKICIDRSNIGGQRGK